MRGRARAWLGGVVALVAGAALLSAAPTQAQDSDLSWPPPLFGPGLVGFIIEDAWLLNSEIRVPTPGSQPYCTSLTDPACVDLAAELGWWIMRVAPPCEYALAWEECVESLRIRTDDGTERELELIGTAPGKTFLPDEARGLPTGSTMSLFKDPGDPSVRYAVHVSGQMGGQIVGPERPFSLNTFAAQVIPYRTTSLGQQPGSQCLFTSAGQCSYRAPFPDGVSYSLSLRLTNMVTGWLGGRLADPTIEVVPLSGRMNRLTVTAQPVDVPLVGIAIPVSQATEEIREYWTANFTCSGNVPCTSGVVSGQSSGPNGSDQLKLFNDFLGDTATRVIPTWSVSNLPQWSPQPCLADSSRLVGLVTTNATIYGAAPPTFAEGSLTYEVSALHRVPGGDVFSGSYDLVLRSDTARCLYGFSDAPVRAEISVTSEDGTEQVATTSVNESDGWLRLSARNFTFSSPKISVVLTSDAPKTKTIVCKKGKKRKKVSGVNPVCPAGWRKIGTRP